MNNVLVVEDELDISSLISYHLEAAGFRVEHALDAEEALNLIESQPFDVVLLDVLLPGMDGWSLCEHLRCEEETRDIPIVFVSALTDEPHKVKGFQLGGDDYITKPFSPRELVSRVNAVLRRADPKRVKKSVRRVGDVAIDVIKHQIRVKCKPIHLTNSEFGLLSVLVENAQKVLSREELLNHIAENGTDLELGNIDVHVHRLRQKLEDDPRNPKLVQTVRGVGYRFVPGD